MNEICLRELLFDGLQNFINNELTDHRGVHHTLGQDLPLTPLRGDWLLMEGIEKAKLCLSSGCKGIVKKQSCKSILIICQFWGIVVGDEIFGYNVPIGFMDVLNFWRSVKRHHLLDFFKSQKWENFKGNRIFKYVF